MNEGNDLWYVIISSLLMLLLVATCEGIDKTEQKLDKIENAIIMSN